MEILLIASNGFSSPRDEWMDQSDYEWVLVLRGSACVALQNPDRIVDLSPGIICCFRPSTPPGGAH